MRKLIHDSQVTGEVVIFNHDPFRRKRLRPEPRRRELDRGEIRVGQGVLGTDGRDRVIHRPLRPIAFETAAVRIHDPVVEDTESRIPLGVGRPVVHDGRKRKHLDDEQWRPLNPSVGNL